MWKPSDDLIDTLRLVVLTMIFLSAVGSASIVYFVVQLIT